MLDFYLSELRRFRTGAAIYALANLVILTVLGQVTNLPGMPLEGHLMILILYALSGLGLALYQLGSYRQPSRWIWLQHRPLHRLHILAAIVLAAITLVALAVALPLFAFLAAQDHYSQHVIDSRYFLGAAWLALATFGAWLAGACIMLQRSRWAFLVLALPWVLALHEAAGSTLLALMLACDLVLLVLVATVFRPDRRVGHGAAATIANALPLQAGFYLGLLLAGSLAYQVALMLVGAHPNNSMQVAHGGYIEALRLEPHETMLAGLAASADPRAGAWRAALAPKTVLEIKPDVRKFAVRDFPSNLGWSTLTDGNTMWTFSHDRMMYRGLQPRTLADAGWLGVGGRGETGPFASQPQMLHRRDSLWLVDRHNVYAMQGRNGSPRHVLHIGTAEQVGGGFTAFGAHQLLLTNRRLLIVDAGAAPGAATSIPLPMAFGDLAHVQAAQVADGMLVSFLYGYRQNEGVAASPQVIYLVDRGGHATEVARRELAHDFPALFEHRDWWVSPALHALTRLPGLLVDNGAVPDDGASRFEPLMRARPPVVWIAAIVATLASSLGALWWTRRTRMTPRERAAWCLACLLLGVPALLSLVVLRPRAPVPAKAPATALTA